mgnify:CR=1 FL=1
MAKNPNRIRMSLGDRLFGIINFAVVTLLMIVMVYPFYYCVILAFNDGVDATYPGIYFWPRVFSLENFKAALDDPNVLPAAVTSILRTVLGTVLTVLVTSAFAYSMSKNNLRFRNVYLVFLMIPMYFGGGMVPTYILLRDLNLLNNFWVYIIPGIFSVYYALIFMASFRELPASLEESAMLDGAGYFRIYFQIILPLSMPVIAAVCVFLAVGHWNSWMDNLLYMPNTHDYDTLAYLFAGTAQRADYLIKLAQESAGASAQIGQQLTGATGISTQLASMLISIAPILVVYPFFQKYFVHGVMIGAVKG